MMFADIQKLSDPSFLKSAKSVRSRHELLALEFHRLMTENSAFTTANPYREGFYAKVISKAAEVKFCVIHLFI